MRDIDSIKEDEKRLLMELSAVRQELREVKLAKAKEKFGVDIGVRVSNKVGQEYIVASIDCKWDKPWLQGNPIKKDGTTGKAIRNLYGNWTVVPS